MTVDDQQKLLITSFQPRNTSFLSVWCHFYVSLLADETDEAIKVFTHRVKWVYRCYPKMQRLRYVELLFCLLFCMGESRSLTSREERKLK